MKSFFSTIPLVTVPSSYVLIPGDLDEKRFIIQGFLPVNLLVLQNLMLCNVKNITQSNLLAALMKLKNHNTIYY